MLRTTGFGALFQNQGRCENFKSLRQQSSRPNPLKDPKLAQGKWMEQPRTRSTRRVVYPSESSTGSGGTDAFKPAEQEHLSLEAVRDAATARVCM